MYIYIYKNCHESAHIVRFYYTTQYLPLMQSVSNRDKFFLPAESRKTVTVQCERNYSYHYIPSKLYMNQPLITPHSYRAL